MTTNLIFKARAEGGGGGGGGGGWGQHNFSVFT